MPINRQLSELHDLYGKHEYNRVYVCPDTTWVAICQACGAAVCIDWVSATVAKRIPRVKAAMFLRRLRNQKKLVQRITNAHAA